MVVHVEGPVDGTLHVSKVLARFEHFVFDRWSLRVVSRINLNLSGILTVSHGSILWHVCLPLVAIDLSLMIFWQVDSLMFLESSVHYSSARI